MSFYKFSSDEVLIRAIRNSIVITHEFTDPRRHWRFAISIPGEERMDWSFLWYRTENAARMAGIEQMEYLLNHAKTLEQRACSHGPWEYHPRACAESDPYWTCVNCGIVKFGEEWKTT